MKEMFGRAVWAAWYLTVAVYDHCDNAVFFLLHPTRTRKPVPVSKKPAAKVLQFPDSGKLPS